MLLDQFYQNDKPKQTLVNFITDGRLPHTVLLEGEDGCGKTTFARMMAAAVLCQQPDVSQRPCGECRNCRLILEDNHPDVVIEQSENKANATSTRFGSCAPALISGQTMGIIRCISCATSTT